MEDSEKANGFLIATGILATILFLPTLFVSFGLFVVFGWLITFGWFAFIVTTIVLDFLVSACILAFAPGKEKNSTTESEGQSLQYLNKLTWEPIPGASYIPPKDRELPYPFPCSLSDYEYRCPRCGSRNTIYEGVRNINPSFLPTKDMHVFRCEYCGKEFREKS